MIELSGLKPARPTVLSNCLRWCRIGHGHAVDEDSWRTALEHRNSPLNPGPLFGGGIDDLKRDRVASGYRDTLVGNVLNERLGALSLIGRTVWRGQNQD